MQMWEMDCGRTSTPYRIIGVGSIPAALGVCIASASLLSFVWAVLAGDVTVLVPFISEAGADPPQSGFFSLMIFISCLWTGITMTIRFSIVRQLLRFNQGECVNILSLVIGYMCVAGLSVVAAFPLRSNNTIHDYGAISMFVLGVLYCCLQTLISAWMYPWHTGRLIVILRTIISFFASISAIVACVAQITAKQIWADSGINKPDDMRLPGDPAFSWYTTAAIAEWVTVSLFVVYFFSFIKEFNKVVVELDTYPLVDHFDDDIEIRFTGDEHMPLYKSVL